MDHKERESKANLAPVREFISRVFSNMQEDLAGPELGVLTAGSAFAR
jgi:hypothetical protein